MKHIRGGGEMIFPNVSYCEDNNEVHYNPIPHDYSKDYLTFVAKEDGTFNFNKDGISYSLDNGETWTAGKSVTVNNGDKVLWKGTMTQQSYQGIGTFNATGNFDVQGNIMSLLFGDNFKGETDLTGKDYVFNSLFNNTKVVNAKNLSLPAQTLANNCYSSMFQDCASLETAPELPATTLARYCYASMFMDCDTLTTAPELPATTLAEYCYYNMFDYCDALTTAPTTLPATTLAESCYEYMFNYCKALTTAPELPATTLAQYCYRYMFQSCESLETAPALPATTLADGCYYDMFNYCKALTTAPELPATTLASECYNGMFRNCTSLETAPTTLPAQTLARRCYNGMFSNCTNLVNAPALPAQTLEDYCYEGMFYGCANLNYIKAMFTTRPGTDYTSNWVNGVATSGTFVKNSAATWNVSGVNGIPDGWTVQTASA